MAEMHMPSNFGKVLDKKLRYLLEGSGYKNDFEPESSEKFMREGHRLNEGIAKTNDIVNELKKDYPGTPFNETRVREIIGQQYDDAVRQQDIRLGGHVNPDGTVDSEGLKRARWRFEARSTLRI